MYFTQLHMSLQHEHFFCTRFMLWMGDFSSWKKKKDSINGAWISIVSISKKNSLLFLVDYFNQLRVYHFLFEFVFYGSYSCSLIFKSINRICIVYHGSLTCPSTPKLWFFLQIFIRIWEILLNPLTLYYNLR